MFKLALQYHLRVMDHFSPSLEPGSLNWLDKNSVIFQKATLDMASIRTCKSFELLHQNCTMCQTAGSFMKIEAGRADGT